MQNMLKILQEKKNLPKKKLLDKINTTVYAEKESSKNNTFRIVIKILVN